MDMYMYIQGTALEIQIATHWKLISHRMMALPPVLSPSSVFSPSSVSLCCHCHKGKYGMCSKNVISLSCISLCNLGMRNLGIVCTVFIYFNSVLIGQGMDVCLCFSFLVLSCVGRHLMIPWSAILGSNKTSKIYVVSEIRYEL